MQNNRELKNWVLIAIISGFAADACYLLATQVSISPAVNRLLFFAFGPFMIVSVTGLYKLLTHERDSIAAQLGTLFLVLSGVSHTIMATMQGANRVRMRELIAGAEGPAQEEIYKAVYRGVFSSQAGVDMAFDIFISLGVILVTLAMWHRPDFGRIVSMLGIVIAATGLSFNIIAFPHNAGNVGLVDPGPFFGFWFLIVVILMIRALPKIPARA